VDENVRHNIRLNKTDGYRKFKFVTKKHKICAVMIDEQTGEDGPVPLAVLQGWGINYGVAPGKLSDDALMQAPST
jgi:hypothetical protein